MKGAPKIPSGAGALAVAAIGISAGAYGLYNSVVTGTVTCFRITKHFLIVFFCSLDFSYGILDIFAVQPGHLGMIYSRIGGLQNASTLREGLNFVVPWFQRSIVFDIRTRPQV